MALGSWIWGSVPDSLGSRPVNPDTHTHTNTCGLQVQSALALAQAQALPLQGPHFISLNPLCHARRLQFHIPYHHRHLHAIALLPNLTSPRPTQPTYLKVRKKEIVLTSRFLVFFYQTNTLLV